MKLCCCVSITCVEYIQYEHMLVEKKHSRQKDDGLCLENIDIRQIRIANIPAEKTLHRHGAEVSARARQHITHYCRAVERV